MANKDFIPTEEEIEAESPGFKVKKGPRIMTPEEARDESPVQSYKTAVPKPIQPRTHIEQDEEGFPEHQSFSLKPTPRKSVWQEGTYEVKIDRAWQAIEPDNFHTDPSSGEPLSACFMHILFVTPEGAALEARTSMSRHKKSVLTSLLTAIFGDQPPIDLQSDDLVGRHVQILVKNKVSATSGNEYPTVKEYLRSTQQFTTAGGGD